MCGIAGIFDPASHSDELKRRVESMNRTLVHRGPDGAGVWLDAERGLALGHRRLAIIDLTEDGHQPMVSRSGRFVITYNGEVYNFKSLRSELQKSSHTFRGHSDTEVILEAIEEWGLIEALRRFIGMFAFALWDREKCELNLVRDRVGKKPLYYSASGGQFLFASELKALKVIPGFDTSLDQTALAEYFQYNYIPAPRTIYRGASKLLPGSMLTIACKGTRPIVSDIARYWSPAAVYSQALDAPFTGTEDQAFEVIDQLLNDAVKLRMISDVPIGAFLSGGVDSSAVAAYMQRLSSRPIRTFTIGTRQDKYNEADQAAAVARHLGTEHTELYVEPNEARAAIPDLPRVYDEPFADSSEIPTLLVSRLARRHVTVALSGDGGDEVFVGYNRYLLADRLRRIARGLPSGVISLTNRLSQRVPIGRWMQFLNSARSMLPKRFRDTKADDRMTTLARMLVSEWPWGIYTALVSHWDDASSLLLDRGAQPTQSGPPTYNGRSRKQAERWRSLIGDMVQADHATYLPDDILVKVDRASMAASMEARAPLLDHRIIEFMATLPIEMSLSGGIGKRLLRRSLYRHVPQALIDRPKSGFAVPIDNWLRNELRDWAEDLLSAQRLKTQGILNPEPVRQAWTRHLSGTRQEHQRLWSVLMFQSWLEHSRESAEQPADAPA